jgi:hypothetical protein
MPAGDIENLESYRARIGVVLLLATQLCASFACRFRIRRNPEHCQQSLAKNLLA